MLESKRSFQGMGSGSLWGGRGVLLALALAGAARADCPVPNVVALQGQTISNNKPRLGWQPVAASTAYRIRVLSRVPNGRIVASHDAVVLEPQFAPPQPLADHYAKVVVRVNAICGRETSAESVASFVIDTSPTCALGDVE